MPRTPRLLIHDHIFKCAGTTIDGTLRSAFAKHFTVNSFCVGEAAIPAIEQALRDGEDVSVVGHAAWGLERFIQADFQPLRFTFLRDPFKLACSVYRYRRNVNHGSRTTLENFLIEHNFSTMTTHLGGGSLDAACERLRGYEYVGFVDSIEEDLFAIMNSVGKPLTELKARGVSSTCQDDIDPDLVKDVSGMGHADFALYEYAKANFVRKSLGRAETTEHEFMRLNDAAIASGKKMDFQAVSQILQHSCRPWDIATLQRRFGGAVNEENLRAAIDIYQDTIIEHLAPERIPASLIPEFVGIHSRLRKYHDSEFPSEGIRRYQRMSLFLARVFFFKARSDPAFAPQHEEYLRLCRELAADERATQQYLLDFHRFLRLQGQLREAADIIRALFEQSPNDYLLATELAATVYELDGIDGFRAATDAFRGRFSRLLLKHHQLLFASESACAVDKTALPGPPFFVGRFGPLFAFHDLLEYLEESFGAEAPIDILIQENVDTGGFASIPSIRDTHRTPIGALNPDAVSIQAAPGLSQSTPIVVCSNIDSVNSLDNVFILLKKLDFKKVYVYPSINAFLEDKIFLPFDLAPGEGAQ